MFWPVLAHLVTFLVDLVLGLRWRDRDKDLQILVLRHQVRLLQRQHPRPPRLTRGEKLTLAVLTAALVRLTADPRCQLDRLFWLLIHPPMPPRPRSPIVLARRPARIAAGRHVGAPHRLTEGARGIAW